MPRKHVPARLTDAAHKPDRAPEPVPTPRLDVVRDWLAELPNGDTPLPPADAGPPTPAVFVDIDSWDPPPPPIFRDQQEQR
jgi:hypothetical protein